MTSKQAVKSSHFKEALGIVSLTIGVFLALCLLSYSPADPALNASSNIKEIHNLGGITGSYTADILFTVFGVSAYVICAVFFLISLFMFLGKSINVRLNEALSYFALVIFASTLFHLRFETVTIADQEIEGGGIVGGLVGEILKRYFNKPGAYVITTACLLFFLKLATHISITAVVRNMKIFFIFMGYKIGQVTKVVSLKIAEWTVDSWDYFTDKFFDLRNRFNEWRKKRKKEKKEAVKINLKSKQLEESAEYEEQEDVEYENDESKDGDGEDEEDSEKVVSLKGLGKKSAVEPKILARADAKKSRRTSKQLEFVNISSNYLFPPLSLLDSEEQVTVKVDEEALKSNSKILELKLKDFDVEGRVTEIHPGPVITMYEFEPSAGTKVSKIANLQSDLSLNMGGRSIRVVPHLPGKAAVGIEVPNYEREIVWLKDIIADPKFKKSKTKLPLAIGKDTEGNSLISDLTKMPHLLIAGATGTGKSVCINAMICSILYKAQPEEVRFLMIDPKMLELSIYDGIPHLLLPVVTRPKKAVVAFNWAVREMERRYRTLADAAVRSIVGYNEKIDKGGLKLVDEEKADEMLIQNPEAVCHVGKLPYIVIIVDELADLMMTASKDIEESITRLAQMARAVGIHLILATQRPSVDVITGLIKANFPCRLSFKVSAKHDSRTILDQNGADHLLGNGDMLFLAPGAQGLKRAHGAFITEVEIERVVAHIKKQGEPVYNEDILKTQESGLAGTLGDEEHDELYDTAIKLVAETHQASISMIQRKLRIGYNRAARMVEMMEEQGIVGPQDGSKPREVLISNLE